MAANASMIPALYRARVMHLRVLPKRTRKHQFRYSVFRLWLDIDRLSDTLSRLRCVGYNRLNLYGFYDRDHGPRDGSSLRTWADAMLSTVGVARAHRIMLYCFPRMFGYEFNPLAMYCAYDAQGVLSGVIYQVRNTDGDLSPYVVNVAREGLRHDAEKAFYVSPFIDGDQRYSFTLTPPQEMLAMRIRVDGRGGLTMIATESAQRQTLTDGALLKLALLRPFMTLKITLGIYFEAVRLRLKGAKFYRHPGNDGLYTNEPDGSNSRSA
jgi:DUF1365 family protein